MTAVDYIALTLVAAWLGWAALAVLITGIFQRGSRR